MFVDRMGLESKEIIGNLDSIRIIYVNSGVGHTHLQIGKFVYTFGIEGGFVESRLKGIGSIVPGIFDSYVSVRTIEEFLLFDKDLIIYDINYTDTQRELLQNFVDDTISGDESYSLLGQNCTSFVQAALVASGIDEYFEEGFGLNIPIIYNGYLNELSKGDYNYINEVYNYNISDHSSEEVELIIETIENNYNNSVDYLLNISPYVK